MTLQNRVDPYGRLHAVAARGAWMGNRGVLHDDARRIVSDWRLRRWITCVLCFRDRRREVFAPRRYSELFFLDEATSLSAGHRPCAECRRERFREFREAWLAGASRSGSGAPVPKADEIDRVLHEERLGPVREKRTHEAPLASLPEGTFVEHGGRPHLLWRGRLRPWTFFGYGAGIATPEFSRVRVLTPPSIVRAIAAGFVPQIHESVQETSPQ